jgi:hypothetical protein
LQLSLLHFREAKLGGWLYESASGIAHARRNQGILWSWALNIWATHLYYEHIEKHDLDISRLPLDVFNTIYGLIERREQWQLDEEVSPYIFPSPVPKSELLQTLRDLYVTEKPEKGWEPAFVTLAWRQANFEEDIKLVRWLVLYCEDMALSIPPTPIDEIVDEVNRGFRELKISDQNFTEDEKIYLQLHLLVSFHNALIDVRSDVFKAITHEEPPNHEAMLSVSAMESTLGLDIAFYYLREGKYLDQADLYSPDKSERYRWPLVATALDPDAFLLESDLNIRCCLFNHPLEVRKADHGHVIVALERHRAEFTPTRSRSGPRDH